jgi:hypothetical protein
VIYIFHGDHNALSYTAFSELVSKYDKHEKFHQSGKNIDPNSLDNFLNTPSLFSETKVVILDNFFSLLKTPFDKIVKLINSHPDFDYLLWQDKKIEAAKLKLFPQSTVEIFTLPELLFSCLNAIKPRNKIEFSDKFQKLMAIFPLELALFWFKNTLRRQLTTYSKFSENNLKKTYLNLIELDKASKNGTLTQPKDMAIEKIILSLLDA